ncbi:MAG TPA: CidA/LrgA family protein [Erysipelothrix sp.]
MHIILQVLIIFLYSFIGDIISSAFNLPVPGSIIGLLLLFLSLEIGLIKLSDINTVGKFLQKNMAILFVPLTVGMMNYYEIIKLNALALLVIILISTTITYFATGYFAQYMIQKEEKHD